MFNPTAAEAAHGDDGGDKGGPREANALDRRVGALIRQRRETLGLTQTDLARRCGVTFQQIQKYERGSNRVSFGRLVQIAEGLSIPPAWFFEGLNLDDADHEPAAIADALNTADGRRIAQVLPLLDTTQRRLVADVAINLAGQHRAAA